MHKKVPNWRGGNEDVRTYGENVIEPSELYQGEERFPQPTPTASLTEYKYGCLKADKLVSKQLISNYIRSN